MSPFLRPWVKRASGADWQPCWLGDKLVANSGSGASGEEKGTFKIFISW